MEEIKRSLSKILDVLDDVQEIMDSAYKNIATFYTSLKEKDINQAYFQMFAVKRGIDSVLEKMNETVDNYEIKVLQMLEEEENDRRKE